jgi:hypothetical protein
MEQEQSGAFEGATFDENLDYFFWDFTGPRAMAEGLQRVQSLVGDGQVASIWGANQRAENGRVVHRIRVTVDAANIDLADKAGLKNY